VAAHAVEMTMTEEVPKTKMDRETSCFPFSPVSRFSFSVAIVFFFLRVMHGLFFFPPRNIDLRYFIIFVFFLVRYVYVYAVQYLSFVSLCRDRVSVVSI
jgi:hypothetical protein